jgi:sterol desaturase/sphingolipid hydroxylase (fatty acid hydroxylase superfamily)
MGLTLKQKIIYPFAVILGVAISIGIVLNREQGDIVKKVDFNTWILLTAGATVGHLFQYLFFGFLMEFANPKEKNEERWNLIKREIVRGTEIIILISICISAYMRYLEDYMPFYHFYDNYTMSIPQICLNVFCFMFLADTWFYWSHRILHKPVFWRIIHYYHHSYIDTTAFSQISVHYIEGLIHGPLVYIVPQLVFPIHPAIAIGIGFPTGIFAIMAHDGEILDVNTHVRHHIYKSINSNEYEIKGCNYSLYWQFWDKLCDTAYDNEHYRKWREIANKEKNEKDN